MPSLLKSTVLGFGLLAGVGAAAHAQSVSSLPPTSTTAPSVQQPAHSSTQSVYPKPGGQSVFQEDHFQPPADWNANKAYHPYSTSVGPKPGSHSSGEEEHYRATEQDAAPARHPYTAPVGPKPGG